MQVDLFDHEAEKSALGIIAATAGMDIQKAGVLLDQSGLTKEVFHLPANRALFEAFGNLLRSGKMLDPFSVREELTKIKLSTQVETDHIVAITMGSDHLHESMMGARTTLIRDLASRRGILEELRAAAASIQKRESDPHDVAGKLSARMVELSATGKRVNTLTDALGGIIDHIQSVHEGKREPVVKTGIHSLDAIIGGFQPTLNMVGALPGVGKSAFIATCAVNIAQSGVKVGVFSLEDAAEWIGWRLLSKESGISQHKLRFEPLPGEHFAKLDSGVTRLQQYANNIFLVDGSDTPLTTEQIVREATNLIMNHGVRCIIIDHLGEVKLSRTHGERNDLDISDCLAAVRGIANKFRVPVVVAAHLKQRDGLGPADEPQLSDFAGTAGVGRKARVALGLSRAPDSDVMSISVLKNTNGVAGYRTKVQFVGQAALLKAA